MPCNIKNPANINLSELEPHINGMYDYFDQKIGFNKPPTMVFDSDPSNQHQVLGKTAYYDPSSLEIHIYSDGRHPKDMLRSIAHELIHHRQNLEGRLDVGGYHGEGYYLENKELKKLEHEAMLEGNALMREYEDTLKRKENKEMSLNEWKNNELNRLLMKKFGILKEEKKKMVKGPDGKMVPDYAVDGKGKKDLAEEEIDEGMYKRDDMKKEAADQNDGLEGVKGDSYGHIKEDSGEEEGEHYDKNRMSDDDHIKAIEHHLAALKKDKDYDEDHEELEETVSSRQDGRRRDDNDPRLRPMEEGNDGLGEPGDGAPEDAMLPDSVKESKNLKLTVRRALKENKKIKLRFKK